MCGIAGVIDRSRATDDSVAEAMTSRLRRRGPDQSGVYRDGPATLVHTRLAVVDIENGIQPMTAKYGQREYCVVYNGELYNTGEIRASLEAKGHRFATRSDTEVLLKAYIEWGEDCVRAFNGIFAFAVWDSAERRLFVARDRMGVKPLFYYISPDGLFVFGSEIKALLCHPAVEPVADAGSVAEIFLIGPGRTPGCGIFRGIREVRAGECGYFCDGSLKLRRYWSLPEEISEDSPAETVGKVRWLVEDAIRRQLVSDVKVCAFLSGGLDSSIIAACAGAAAEAGGERLTTFSVGYAGNDKFFKADKFQPDSDDRYIGLMSEMSCIEHHKVVLDPGSLAEALTDAVRARDLPGMADVDSSLLLFCREVKKYATVALSGECADEIFGGYPWYHDGQADVSSAFPWSGNIAYRMRFMHPDYAAAIADPAGYVAQRAGATAAASPMIAGAPGDEAAAKAMTHINLDWFMQTLLDRKDRMSMYSGLEVRVPFCDHRIAEYLYTVPRRIKNMGGREKGLLREAMRGLLPDDVLWRKKSPYPKTHDPAYLGIVAGMLRDIVSDSGSPLLRIADRRALEDLIRAAAGGGAGAGGAHVRWYGQLMTEPQTIAYFVQTDIWLREYGVRLA